MLSLSHAALVRGLAPVLFCVFLAAGSTACFASGRPPQADSSSQNTFYASLAGRFDAKGNKKKPWDLATALAQPGKVKPGDTILLRGGTYSGKFISNLAGVEGKPITVRSYPGEWARIDGFVSTSLAGAINESDSVIRLVEGSKFPQDTTVVVDEEVIYLLRKLDANTYRVLRPRGGGSPATAHSNGAAVYDIGSALTINGAYVIFRDIEIMNSDPARVYKSLTLDPSNIRGAGVTVNGHHTKLIDLVVHDNRDGIGFWESATESEINGCIVYNNGIVMSDRSHGHGIYIQNQAGTKLIKDVISLNNFVTGMKAFGVEGFAENIRFEGNVSFNNGSPASFGGNPAGYDAGHRFSNLLVATRNNPMRNIEIVNNSLYDPAGTLPEFSSLGIGVDVAGNDGLTVTGNRVMGAAQSISMFGWSHVQFTDNTLYTTSLTGDASNEELAVVRNPGALNTYGWNSNTYFDSTRVKGCAGPSSRVPFSFPGAFSSCARADAGMLTFNDWRSATGFDSASQYTAGKPPSNEVIIRPSQYERGRAHIIVFNWKLKGDIQVDLSSVLSIGTDYEVRSAQDYLGAPLVVGTFDGKPVRLPMTGLGVATPVGLGFTPQSTEPEFNVFVVKPR